MHKILVASKNPVKIQTTINAFKRMFPLKIFEIEGVDVSSSVSNQPIGEEETMRGAISRVNSIKKDADYKVGIEGGVREVNGKMESFACIAVLSKNGILGISKSGSFFLPPKVSELIKKGYELGDADDIVFGKSNSKQQNGAVGLLTHDTITRTSLYEEAVILALIPHKNPTLYPKI